MKFVHPWIGGRYGLAILGGLLLAFAFPKIGIAGFAWVAPGLMAAAALGTRGWESFRIGYLAGLTHYLVSLYWLTLIPYRWHGIPFGPITGWLALAGFLALLPAAWVWAVTNTPKSTSESLEGSARIPQPKDPNPRPTFRSKQSQDLGASLLSERVALGPTAVAWSQRTLWAFSGAAIWVALEMFIARFLGGFPWDLLGVSQYRMVPLVQIASFTGVYGVSFLVVWFSLSLLSAGLAMIRRPTNRSVWVAELFLPLLVVAGAFNFGFQRINHTGPSARTIRLTLIQPSIPQEVIWDSASSEQRFAQLLQLCRQALTNKTDLLVWPEAAVPKLLRYDQATFDAVTGLSRDHHVWLIVGADDAEPRHGATNPQDADFYNSSFLISPEGEIVERYRKRNLVIFGEYVPLARWLPFLRWFTPIEEGFTPGDHAVPFVLRNLAMETSILICFEDTFPQLGRQAVGAATDFVVNLTNDGWFDEGAAQWQHAASALFRAIENGVPLIRCTNNGLTCWIDPQGRMHDVFRDSLGQVYGVGFETFELPLPGAGETSSHTFYNRHGDWLGWGCVAVGLVILGGRSWTATRLGRRGS